MVTYSL